MKEFIVTIDGPAGSGKSTIAKLLAQKYGLTYLDTGAMYRMATLYALQHDLDINDKKDIDSLLSDIKIDIKSERFLLNGIDVTKDIRTPNVTKYVSPVSAIKEIRQAMVEQQRQIGQGKMSILDGRDIGTVVFPHADVKIFLVASPEVRAQRRYKEYIEKGISQDYDTVLADIKRRDQIDSTRKESPLKKAFDAIEIDSSNMSIDEVVEAISKEIDKHI